MPEHPRYQSREHIPSTASARSERNDHQQPTGVAWRKLVDDECLEWERLRVLCLPPTILKECASGSAFEEPCAFTADLPLPE